MPRRRIGILGGSYNPVHVGHLMVASYIRQVADLDEVWLSLSPANPLKTASLPAGDDDRLAMLRLAVREASCLQVCDEELRLPRPSYTLQLLDFLADKYPECRFTLIIGSDNWLLFDRWRDPDTIRQRYGLVVYPRPGYPMPPDLPDNVTVIDAPSIDLSSTFIRQAVSDGLDMNFFLPSGVYSYIKEHNLYK